MAIRYAIRNIYRSLLKSYGPQGWWPFYFKAPTDEIPTENEGYHPGNYDYPKTDDQRLEICLGAILTQNTHWQNVVIALKSLENQKLNTLERLDNSKIDQIGLAIKSAGYYNQKAAYIKNLVRFFKDSSFVRMRRISIKSARDKLLGIKGIGPETADCILLYALGKPSFVVDAYTKRILYRLGIINRSAGYRSIKDLFESSMPRRLDIYQEYHALLVRHGKNYYGRKPYGVADPILAPLENP